MAPGQRARTGRSGWETSQRNARVMRRWATVCHVCNEPGGDEVDHVIALALGGPDTEDNLRPIHAHPCHAAKTLQDRLEAAERRKAHPL